MKYIFTRIFDSFMFVIILKTFKFLSSFKFTTHILLDAKSIKDSITSI